MTVPLRLHLIRHGETNWNREKRVQGQSESTLTALGQQQALALRPILAEHPIVAVYCSSSLRTRETAALLFDANELPPLFMDELREIHLGHWETQLHSQIREQDPTQFRHFWHEPHRFRLHGAEGFDEIQTRACAAFDHISRRHPRGGEIAIVSHGVWIKSLLCALEPRPLSALWEPPVMHNCAHSIVERQGDNTQILQYATVTPLAD